MKNILLTGASSGLGNSLAIELAKAGHHLGLIGRSEKKHEELLSHFSEEAKANSKFLEADLADPSQVSRVVARWGKKVDWLIHCAGMSITGKIEDIPLEEFARCWQVNYGSAVSLAQQVLPGMKEQKSGLIVNVSSGVARRALPYAAPYCSAKAALNSFTDSLRVESAPYGIRVLLFSPGPVASHFHENIKHYGSPLRFPPFFGKPPKRVAAQLLRAIEGRKARVIIGGKAAVAHHLQYWSPGFTDRLVQRLYRIEN